MMTSYFNYNALYSMYSSGWSQRKLSCVLPIESLYSEVRAASTIFCHGMAYQRILGQQHTLDQLLVFVQGKLSAVC